MTARAKIDLLQAAYDAAAKALRAGEDAGQAIERLRASYGAQNRANRQLICCGVRSECADGDLAVLLRRWMSNATLKIMRSNWS